MNTVSETPAIVFDLGGVLIDWNPRHLYRQLFNGDDAAMERFLAEVCTSGWNAKQDAGRPFAEGVAELTDQFPEQASLIEAFHTRWIEMVSGPIQATVKVLEELAEAGYPLYALSNWSAETFPLVHKQFDFLNHFQTIVLSGEIKMIKPAPEIYHHLLAQINRDAEACLFIDDSFPNIVTARQLGFEVIHFQSPVQLRVNLSERGLL